MNPTIRQIIGQNVQARRVAAGDSQKKFAQRLDALSTKPHRAWTVNAVSESETGKRTWTADDVVLFARALGVSPGALFDIPAAVANVDIDGEAIPRASVQPVDSAQHMQAMTHLTRALDGHLDQIAALQGAVEQTYADAIGVRKEWLRQAAQPRQEEGDQ